MISYSRSDDAVIRVHDDAGNVMETHEHKGRFQGVVKRACHPAAFSEMIPSMEAEIYDKLPYNSR